MLDPLCAANRQILIAALARVKTQVFLFLMSRTFVYRAYSYVELPEVLGQGWVGVRILEMAGYLLFSLLSPWTSAYVAIPSIRNPYVIILPIYSFGTKRCPGIWNWLCRPCVARILAAAADYLFPSHRLFLILFLTRQVFTTCSFFER